MATVGQSTAPDVQTAAIDEAARIREGIVEAQGAQGIDVEGQAASRQATEQLLQESIQTQMGGPSVITSEAADAKTGMNQENLQRMLTAMQQKAEETGSVAKEKAAQTQPLEETGTPLSPLEDQLSSALTAMEEQVNAYTSQLDQFAATLDAQNQARVELIKQTYDRRRDQTNMLNEATLQSQRLLGARSGRQRYATEIQTSILSAEEAAGIQRLADLDMEEQQLILEAEQANSAQQFDLLNQKMTQLNNVNAIKIETLQKQQSLALQQEQLILQQAQEARQQAKFEFETEQELASSLAGSLGAMFTGNPETDQQLANQFAAQYGLDPNMLYGEAAATQREFEANALDIAANYMDLAQQIPEGQIYEDPARGIYIVGTQEPEAIDVVQTVGGMEYKVRYNMVDGQAEEVFRIPLGPRWKGGTGGTGDTETTPMDAMLQAATALHGAKQTGEFNDFTYNTYVDALVGTFGGTREDVENALNQKLASMEGVPTTNGESQDGGTTPIATQLQTFVEQGGLSPLSDPNLIPNIASGILQFGRGFTQPNISSGMTGAVPKQ